MVLAKETTFYAHGKLLLTAEYAVLDGAKALCLPTKLGQKMIVEEHSEKFLEWNAFLPQNELWFKAKINQKLELIDSSNQELGKNLLKTFKGLKNLNSSFFVKPLKISTFLEFDKSWGLGSSSTLISLLSQWARVNPYKLLDITFGGSGYDIACATAKQPIIYQDKHVTEVDFKPQFLDSLFFIYLNKKKNSRDAIQHYRSKPNNQGLISRINELTKKIIDAETLNEFESCINEHEIILSEHLEVSRIKDALFPDYNYGVIKSLGGWGGDFILATGNKKNMNYFKDKGYSVIFSYPDLIL